MFPNIFGIKVFERESHLPVVGVNHHPIRSWETSNSRQPDTLTIQNQNKLNFLGRREFFNGRRLDGFHLEKIGNSYRNVIHLRMWFLESICEWIQSQFSNLVVVWSLTVNLTDEALKRWPLYTVKRQCQSTDWTQCCRIGIV